MNDTIENISVIIIAKNAGKVLKRCLDPLQVFREVVLLIDASTSDDTAIVASEYPNVKVIHSPFLGFGKTKKRAESFASNDWLFSVDSDEVATAGLIEEIQQLDLSLTENLYSIYRKNFYRGTLINGCGWGNDFVLRIYNRRHTSFADKQIHEHIIQQPGSRKIVLKHSLLHYPYNSVKGLLHKLNHYSELYAEENFRKKKSSAFKAIYKGAFSFFSDYFLKRGWLYGSKGFLISLCNANGAFYKYYKLKERNEELNISLIITTYNRPDALEVVLKSVLQQTLLPDEIIVADDGSREDTRLLVSEYAAFSPVPIHHVRQEDDGFRAAHIRNKAIVKASGEFLSIIDGDMVLHPDFIKIIHHLAAKKTFYQGKRVLLTADKAKDILQTKKNPQFSFFSGGIRNRFNSISSKWLSPLLSKKVKNINSIKSCSIHVWREDAILVNGFNEDFIGWGREDSEFACRLLNKGVQRKNIILGSVAYHLFHPEAARAMLPVNDKILNDAIREKKDWCPNGIDKYLDGVNTTA